MNDLEKYFWQNNNRQIQKWIHYFDIYERHFGRFRNKKITVLEIGVWWGGSLQMWKHYFGTKANIYGIDINPDCKSYEEENIKVLIGSQSDREFLRDVKKQIPPIDILIDDGGHSMEQQIVTFDELFGHVKENGVYVCEDSHTSYWEEYGGGLKKPGTFIEYSKDFIDRLHAYHSKDETFTVDEFTGSVDSVCYYDSMVMIEKKQRSKPYYEIRGNFSVENRNEKKRGLKKFIPLAWIPYLVKFRKQLRRSNIINRS